MPLITILTGVVSILLGVGLFAVANGEGHHAPTALIPAYVGAGFVVLGAIAFKAKLRPHVMHAAAAIALLLVIGGLGMSVPKLFKYYNGTFAGTARPLAWYGQIALATIMAAFETVCVMSFIQARRWRKSQPGGFEVTPTTSA